MDWRLWDGQGPVGRDYDIGCIVYHVSVLLYGGRNDMYRPKRLV